MYVKRHPVRRGEKRYVYLRLVEAYRDEQGRVRQRVLRTLGREDELKASGQLEQLMGSFARLDPPRVGVRREVGSLLLAWHFIGELALVGTIDRALPQRGRQQLSVGEVVARQVRTLQAATGDGVSLYLRPDPGNCSELALVGQSLERLRRFARPGMLM